MKISHTGGIIAAASRKVAKPNLQVGAISVIQRIVITYQQAGVFPIAIITSRDNNEVRQQLSSYGVIFLVNDQDEQPELFSSVRIGLEFMKDKCDRVLFTPVNVPMFTPGSLRTLMKSESLIAIPTYEGRGGHPVMIDNQAIPDILNYNGCNGLRGAYRVFWDRQRIPVDDKGVVTTLYNEVDLTACLKENNKAILHPVLHMRLEKEESFFNARMKLLLFLIHETHNMRLCCTYSGIAYSKAWDMLNRLETNLGFAVIERRRGGKNGGSTVLTKRGIDFLLAYQNFEEEVHTFAQTQFQKQFILTKII